MILGFLAETMCLFAEIQNIKNDFKKTKIKKTDFKSELCVHVNYVLYKIIIY